MADRYVIKNFTANAVGVGKKAHVDARLDSSDSKEMLAQALKNLDSFVALLSLHSDAVANPQQVEYDSNTVRKALGKHPLRRQKIEGLLAKISLGVSGVTALSEAINAVQGTIARIFT